MTKDILLAIKGLQFDGSEDNALIETMTNAEYYKRNNSHFVMYEEAHEGFSETSRNIIKFKENSLELTKKGLVNVHMVFEENKKSITNYATPYGDIMLGIDAQRISMKEEPEQISVDVDYALEMNYEHMADCHISILLQARKDAVSEESMGSN